ncbi:MAG: hypothetical protein KKC84_04360 [Candidatus Omnitrophica bacterium]|nr:hypothetical protein [Candidatus Omnitrophota bacterium]
MLRRVRIKKVWVFFLTLIALFAMARGGGGFCAADEPFVYNSKGKRNPFISMVTPDGQLRKIERSAQEGDLMVEGIIYDKYGYSYAIVNGLVVNVGSDIGGYRVVRIEPSRVIFSKDDQLTEVDLNTKEE